MDFKTLNLILPDLIDIDNPLANYPIMIRGRHGIGKSQLVYQLGKRLGLEVVERRASQMQEGDLVGMPKQAPSLTDQGTEYASFNSFGWFVDCCENARILFFDEVDRGQPAIRQGIMELTDSRKLFGKTLHPKTIIVAAVNGGKYGAEYQVGEMDPAELNRWTIYDVEPTVEDWLDYTREKIHPVMWDFINQNRDHLEHKGPFEPNEIYPSRRSVVRLNSVLARGRHYKEMATKLDRVMNLSMGFFGLGTAVAFREFVMNYDFQLTVEDIVDNGKYRRTEDWGINDHLAMTVKLSNSGILSDKLTAEQLKNVANYFVMLPSEVAAKFWVLFCGSEEENFQNPNLVGFSQTVAFNGLKVAQHYGEILPGDETSDK